jgi:pyocin large subunit-like protein
MSINHTAVHRALDVEIVRASTKFVFVAMAALSNEKGLSSPTIEELAKFTGLHERTVRTSIKRLRQLKHLIDTRKRRGTGNQIPIYKINLPAIVAA